ncbi:CpsD/CapB family tyrosine-protein kinase [Listeria aquatica]|uniref:non-specific protein-tyrosine kinase n=1 Tax=Listeria aquatica TaxID=1494960 RepID=A0A841ZPA4_9LIST|nr:CpsD/CapB family tyrosine-protein kinase [Listeria aquatica]MBC1520511.1 CpsD/CapB family tyrosine-protein kinase [Listeria aquatica]
MGTKTLLTQIDSHSPLYEQFRMIRTGIDFTSIDKENNVVMVTSSESGTGKSTIASNIAVVTAQSGKKTLLIDTDLRKPTIHKIFSKNMYNGLSNLITGDLELEKVLQKTSVKNLSIMTSGIIPPNPTDLLVSTRMKKILAELRTKFDFIIIDTPPVTIVPDALVLADEIDGAILVIRYHKTLKEEAKKALDKLKFTRVNLLGAILNGTKDLNKNYYYY